MTLTLHQHLSTTREGFKAVVICGDGCGAMTARHPRPHIEVEKTFGGMEAARVWAGKQADEWARVSPVAVRVRVWVDGKEEVKP